jgi:hypothetical protein
VMGFFEKEPHEEGTLCPGLASNHNPPDLCLLNSQDYRYEPPVQDQNKSFKFDYLRYFFPAMEG